MSESFSHAIEHCRACSNAEFKELLDLGIQYLTGRFPGPGQISPPEGELKLVLCDPTRGGCGLVQLSHSCDPGEMYGDNYGYASSITKTMQDHLSDIAGYTAGWSSLKEGGAVLDIGSNDGTLLNNFAGNNLTLLGSDPSAGQHRAKYPMESTLIVDLFSADRVEQEMPGQKFNIITSIAMLYDVENLSQFMGDIARVLAEDGVWLTEQSHVSAMYEKLCYDSICHEHVTYLSLAILKKLANDVGLRVLDVRRNNINGGSFQVLFAHKNSSHTRNSVAIERFLESEQVLNLDSPFAWKSFCNKIEEHRKKINDFLADARKNGELVLGYGASTKGNVILQHCGIDPNTMPAILERDPRKFGRRTPGTNIPIISEEEGRAQKPAAMIVFPWHFRDEIIRREKEFLESGGKLVFPLPEFTVVTTR